VYEEVENIPKGVNIRDGNDILPDSGIWYYGKGFNKGSPSSFSNEFRYTLLYKNGGLWADTDVVLLKKLELNNEFIFISEMNNEKQQVTTSVMYSKDSKQDIFRECIDEIGNVDKDSIRHGDIGPTLFDYKVKEYDLKNYVKPPEEFCSINWDELYKFFDDSELSEETKGLHLWQSRWKVDGFVEYKEYDKNCIFEKLKEKYL
jgi:mannosyltransferase OCH1-like enzyme